MTRFAIALCLAACSPARYADAPTLDIRCDAAFTDPERRAIQLAALDVARSGPRVVVRFDLLADAPDLRDRMLLRVPGEADAIRTVERMTHGRVWGVVTPDRMRVLLVADRIPSDKLESTVAHEFWHVVGLDDIDGGRVMSSAPHRTTEMNGADLDEVARVLCR